VQETIAAALRDERRFPSTAYKGEPPKYDHRGGLALPGGRAWATGIDAPA